MPTEWTPGQINIIRWTHFRTERRARKWSIERTAFELIGKGADISAYQVREADRHSPKFRRYCEGKPGFLRAITELFGKPTELGE